MPHFGQLPEAPGLEAEVQRLPEPVSFGVGVRHSALVLPDNILCFRRDRAQQLSGPGQTHHRHVLICALRTGGVVLVDHKHIRLAEGHAMLVLPLQFHLFVSTDAAEVCWLFVTFQCGQQESLTHLRYRTVPLSSRARTLAAQLAACYNVVGRGASERGNAVVLAAASLLEEIVHADLERDDVAPPATERGKGLLLVKRVNEYAFTHPDQDLSVGTLASRFHVSRTYLSAVYRRTLGLTPAHYIREVRLRRAAALLLETEMNVSEAAYASGYNSLFAFSRAFKATMGVAPRVYRAQNRSDGLGSTKQGRSSDSSPGPSP